MTRFHFPPAGLTWRCLVIGVIVFVWGFDVLLAGALVYLVTFGGVTP